MNHKSWIAWVNILTVVFPYFCVKSFLLHSVPRLALDKLFCYVGENTVNRVQRGSVGLHVKKTFLL